MNKFTKNFSMIIAGFAVSLAILLNTVPEARAEDLDTIIARLKSEVAGLDEYQQESAQSISQVETEYKDVLEKYREEAAKESTVTDYDAKIAEAKAKRQAEKIDVSADSEVDLFGSSEETSETKAVAEKAPAAEKAAPKAEPAAARPAYPLERNPRYVAPASQNSGGSKRGRRPFTRSDNNLDTSEIYYASRSYSENFGFAKEETGGVYTGTTEENVFVFSDNLANYCQIDTKSLDKMIDCLNKIVKDKSGKSQSVIDNVTTMVSESLQDLTSHAVADSARYKNDSSGYEKNVLLPLQEKSSKATDERGDIEVLTLTDMEALKLKNKILQTYATMLSVDSFRAISTFEVSNKDMTDIDEEYNAEVEKKSSGNGK